MGFFDGLFGGDGGASDAFEQQEYYTKKAGEELTSALGKQEDLFKSGMERYSPYANMGMEGLPQLMQMAGMTPSAGMADMFAQQGLTMPTGAYDVTQDPGYQFRFDEGQRALERRAAAGGQRFSGGTLAELSRYGQDYASQEYDKAFGRLAGLQNQMYGYGATGRERMTSLEDVMAQRHGQYGMSQANLMTGLGSAAANAKLAEAQQESSGLGELLKMGTSLALAPTTGGGSLLGGFF